MHTPSATGVPCSVQAPFPPAPLPGQRAARLGRPRILHLSSILPTPGAASTSAPPAQPPPPQKGFPECRLLAALLLRTCVLIGFLGREPGSAVWIESCLP